MSLYGDVVEIARDARAFVDCCDTVLGESHAQRARRVGAGLEAVWRLTWDDTAAFVRRALDQPPRPAAAAPIETTGTARRREAAALVGLEAAAASAAA